MFLRKNNKIFRKLGYIWPRLHLARGDLVKHVTFQLMLTKVSKIIYANIYTERLLDEDINDPGIGNLGN